MYKITQAHLQGCRNPHECVNGHIFLAPFYIANVVVVQISFFGELLLAPSGIPAMRPDVFA